MKTGSLVAFVLIGIVSGSSAADGRDGDRARWTQSSLKMGGIELGQDRAVVAALKGKPKRAARIQDAYVSLEWVYDDIAVGFEGVSGTVAELRAISDAGCIEPGVCIGDTRQAAEKKLVAAKNFHNSHRHGIDVIGDGCGAEIGIKRGRVSGIRAWCGP